MEISIIVPVYNVEKYIDRCIDSILNQTFKDFELILVNDGSTDNSGDICDKYSKIDSRIKVIHKINGGVSSARNVGIDNANGKYIQFIDPDDWVDDLLLERSYNTINNEDSDIVFLGIKYEDFISKRVTKRVVSKEIIFDINKNIKHDAIKLIKDDLFGFTWCKLFKASIIKSHKIKFDESISLAEDEKFTCDYYKYINKISVLDEAYYYYVKYGNERQTLCSMSGNSIYTRDKIFKSWMQMLDTKENDIFIKTYLSNKSFSNLYEEVYNIYFEEKNKVTRNIKLSKLKNTYFYNYLVKNYTKYYQKILLFFINNNKYEIFKIFNKLYYILKLKNKR